MISPLRIMNKSRESSPFPWKTGISIAKVSQKTTNSGYLYLKTMMPVSIRYSIRVKHYICHINL